MALVQTAAHQRGVCPSEEAFRAFFYMSGANLGECKHLFIGELKWKYSANIFK